MLNKILKVLNAVSQVILTITALISVFTAYIVFAPDELPKPFRLSYVYEMPAITTPVAVSEHAVSESTEEASADHEFQPGEGIMLNMSTKIINLVDPGGRKYIRLTVVVEVAPDNPEYETLPEEEKTHYLTEFEDKLNSRLPIMDDTVITLLSTKTYEDLYTAEGKEHLREEIMSTLSEKLSDLHIISVYFTEFVVQ
jgi:flagellar basal body-associated protein FliL